MALRHKRSATGRHELLPASSGREENVLVPVVPFKTVASWNFGKGTVIRTIWPAVLLHTAFAALVTSISLKTSLRLGVPPVLITVLGVVIGFVIAYRASSGYDRYWMGRCCWSDLTRTCRTMGRLIWFHVPLRIDKNEAITEDTSLRVMREKRLALELIEGFVVALKHHLRGELGIYFEDLYHLSRPLHNHYTTEKVQKLHQQEPTALHTSLPSDITPHQSRLSATIASPTSSQQTSATGLFSSADPVVPPINSYGTFHSLDVPASRRRGRVERRGSSSGSSSCSDRSTSQGHRTHPFLLPSTYESSSLPISTELIPFSSTATTIARFFSRKSPDGMFIGGTAGTFRCGGRSASEGRKKRPKIAGDGENLPLEILRCLSEWVSVLDERETVPGNPLGGLYGCLSSFEDSLSALERILTTPLPFVYSTQIRQCVWIYLFILPFQMVDQFGWFTIPGVAVAAFFYIGFLAAGEEIEQPFGYDENDLDLDLFCHEIVHADIESLLRTPSSNAVLAAKHERHPGSHGGAFSIEKAASLSPEYTFLPAKGKGTSSLRGVFGGL